MFVFSAAGVLCVALIIMALYLNGLRHRESLRLTAFEVHLSWRRIAIGATVGLTALICGAAALILTGPGLPFAGLLYFTLFLTLPLTQRLFNKVYPPPRGF